MEELLSDEENEELNKLIVKTIEEFVASKGKDPKKFVFDVHLDIFEIGKVPMVYSPAWQQLTMPVLPPYGGFKYN